MRFSSPVAVAAVLAALLASPGVAQDADDEIAVRPFSIRETRERHLVAGDLKPEHPAGNSLTVTLLLEGAPVGDATHYSEPVVSEATDDRGNSLIEKRGAFRSGHFNELNREHMWFFEDEKPQDKIKIDVSLKAPPREARAIEKLSGTVVLRQIVTKPHRIANLASLVGKKVENPALEKAGVEVQIVKWQPGQPNEVLEFKLKDPNERVRDFELVDAKGESVSSGYGSFGFGGTSTVQMTGNDSVPETARLELAIVSGEPVVIPVPFELSEPLPLP